MKNLKILGLSDTLPTDFSVSLFPSNLKEISFSGTGIYKKDHLEHLKAKMPKQKFIHKSWLLSIVLCRYSKKQEIIFSSLK